MSTQPAIGSLWRKWDLHVHTPSSILSNHFTRVDGAVDWEAYVQALEQSGAAVIGVTDYFTIDGYRRLREFKTNGRLANVTLLPNIEFRLDKVLVRGDGTDPKRLNFHVIFSEEVDPQLIEDHFLHNLDFCDQADPQQPDKKLRLKTSNLQVLGERLKAQEPAFANLSALEVGAMNAVVSDGDIVKILTADSRFEGRYLLVLADAYTSGLPWSGQDHLIRKVLLQKSDLVFSSNAKTATWCLGKAPYTGGAPAFIDEFRTLKPCVHGSDAHDNDAIGKPCSKRSQAGHSCATGTDCDMRFCWIKADPTFEGLRQLTYEPESRVRCQPDDPTPIRSAHSLTHVDIPAVTVNAELSLSAVSIPMNPQLIAVAGGRGGGKTALVDLIANCYQDRANTEDRNSFVTRIAEDAPSLSVGLKYVNDAEFTKALTDGTFFQDGDLVYIAQGELEDHVANTANLAQQIETLILSSARVADSVKRYELDRAGEQVDELASVLEEDNDAVARAEAASDAAKKATVETEIKKKRGEVEDLAARVETRRGRLSAERVKEAEQRQQELSKLRDRDQNIGRLQALLQQIAVSVQRAEGSHSLQIAEANDLVKALGTWKPLPGLQYGGKTALTELRGHVETDRAKTAADIERLSKELSSLKGEEEGLARTLDQKKKAEVELKQLEGQLKAIVGAEAELAQIRATRRGRFKALLEAIVARRSKYTDVIAVFSENRERILSDLDFQAEIIFDEETLRIQAEDLLDNRRAPLAAADGRPGILDEYMAHAKAICAAPTPDVELLVAEGERLAGDLRTKLKPARSKGTAELHRLLFANYFGSRPSVTYKRTHLTKLSMGQKATVLIKIYLADGTKPIVIDSHDDHLDNEFIMDELVEGIRQAKDLRQVILVSNNGNCGFRIFLPVISGYSCRFVAGAPDWFGTLEVPGTIRRAA